MAFKDTQRRGMPMEFHGFILRSYLWITIFVIVCEYFCTVSAAQGLVLVVKKRNGNTHGRCSDAAIYKQASWELYESCCQELYPGQTCPLACPCRHGSVCIPSLMQCHCKPGFAGRRCEQDCRSRFNDTWGIGCAKRCRCGPDAECDQYLGTCRCIDENSCTRRCGKYNYGPQCEKKCTTCQQLGLECDSDTGSCDLPSFLRDTSNNCGCKNGGRCLPNGKCDCFWGFHGAFCQLSCPENFYGMNCARTCSCGKNAICTPDVGNCRCKNGMGYNCTERCPPGYFGPRCEYECKCPDGLECSQQNGDCVPTQDTAKHLSDVLPKDRSRSPLVDAIGPESESQTTPAATSSNQANTNDTNVSPSGTESSNLQAANRQQDTRVVNQQITVPPVPSNLDEATTTKPTMKTTPKPITSKPPPQPPAMGDSIYPDQEYSQLNGSGPPLKIQDSAPHPAVITTHFYPSNKLWGVLAMIGFLLVVLVVLLATLLVKRQRTESAEDEKLRRLKKLTKEDNIYETVSELQRNSALQQHPLHLAIFGAATNTPSTSPPMTPSSPRPVSPPSPCPGTPLLQTLPGVSAQTFNGPRRSESMKVRRVTDTLPKVPVKMNSMRETAQDGVQLREKLAARRPRSIHGLSGIHEGEYADAFATLDSDKPARFSLLEEIANEGGKKKPFYFVLEAEDNGKSSKGYDTVELHIPGSDADREKTLELAKQGIIYSTVERKRRNRIESNKRGNYENPPDILPATKCDRPSLVRVDSRKRVVKELCNPLKGDDTDYTYGKLKHSTSMESDHVYGRLGPSTISGSRDLLDDTYGYDQISRSVPLSPADPHLIEAEVYSDNVYDQLDRNTGDILVDGKLQRKGSKRGEQPVYDTVHRQESIASRCLAKPNARNYQYDHVERQNNIFTPISPDVAISIDNTSNKGNTLERPENVYDQLHAVNTVSQAKPIPSARKAFGAKVLNRFQFGLAKNKNPPRRKNVTYADFWLDFSLKKKVEDYLKATNSLPRTAEAPNEEEGGRPRSDSSGSQSDSSMVIIDESDLQMDIDDNQKPHGYESVTETTENTDAGQQQTNATTSDSSDAENDETDSDMEVNIHCQLEKRYSKIQEHMQSKFQIQNTLSLPANILEETREKSRKDEKAYAELRSVEDLTSPLSDVPPYDQFKRTKVTKHLRSASDTTAAIVHVDNKAKTGYQKIAGNVEKKSSNYDHLERPFGGSRQDLLDVDGSECGYGNLLQGQVSPPLNKSVSLATEDGWMIVPDKDSNGRNKTKDKEDVRLGKRLPHQYSNTSMYEEIWPGGPINEG